MKAKKVNRKQLTLTAVILLITIFLSACGSSKTDATSKKEETAKVTAANEVVEEVKEEPIPEPTAEPTPEPTPEAVMYEGIDMESTLPGADWVETFNGIIEEPKFVVFNDKTNKKMIIEEGQKVEKEAEDTLGVYTPDGYDLVYTEGEGNHKTLYFTSHYSELTIENVSSNGEISAIISKKEKEEEEVEVVIITCEITFL